MWNSWIIFVASVTLTLFFVLCKYVRVKMNWEFFVVLSTCKKRTGINFWKFKKNVCFIFRSTKLCFYRRIHTHGWLKDAHYTLIPLPLYFWCNYVIYWYFKKCYFLLCVEGCNPSLRFTIDFSSDGLHVVTKQKVYGKQTICDTLWELLHTVLTWVNLCTLFSRCICFCMLAH